MTFARARIMGVVNVTPNSFSDGGQFFAEDAAVAHGLSLLRDGADILDVGGEATNPHAEPVDGAEELRRIVPVVRRLAEAGATVSIDTTKAVVARAAVAAGATIINDVSGGLFDPDMAEAIGDATYIVGHLRGRSIAEVFSRERMAQQAALDWATVADELAARLAALPAAAAARAWVDPGLGFGKGGDPEVNLALLRHSGDLGARLARPVVIGASRKRFVRRAYGLPARPDPDTGVSDRARQSGQSRAGAGDRERAGEGDDLAALDAASVTASRAALAAGANVVRVHNVALLRSGLAL